MNETVRLRVSPEAAGAISEVIHRLTEEFAVDINRNRQYKRATTSDAVIWMSTAIDRGRRTANREYRDNLYKRAEV